MQEQLVGLLGHPVEHSKSPRMHNHAFAALELPYHYMAFDIQEGDIETVLSGLKAMGFRGVNVTIPYKMAVIPFLDQLTPVAKAIGAVNTITYSDGQLIGDNTDGKGYLRSLQEEFPSLELSKLKVGLVGTGGAARAVGITLALNGVQALYITNRNREKAEVLAREINQWTTCSAFEFEHFEQMTPNIDLLIHTTPVGMSPNMDQTLIPESWIHPHHIISDLIYNPLETKLLQIAKQKGARVHSGLGMLLHQGALAFEQWTNKKAPIHIMKEALGFSSSQES